MDRKHPTDPLPTDDAFAELLGNASPRPCPPAEDEALVRAAVEAEWRQVTTQRGTRRRRVALAAAASVLGAVFGALGLLREPLPAPGGPGELAAVEKQFGEISINGGAATGGIAEGDAVRTGDQAGLALAWHDGGSLRLDAGTEVVFEAPGRIFLAEGRVYFDSTGSALATAPASPGALSIRTGFGTVRHLGTQYMTQVDDDSLVVAVREGLVSIDGRARAGRGQQFSLSADGTLSSGETNGVDGWEWVERSTPAVDLNGRRVHEALEWVSRESGRRIEYRTAVAETLHGNFDIEPSRALEVFMLTVDLEARIEGEVIVVSED